MREVFELHHHTRVRKRVIREQHLFVQDVAEQSGEVWDMYLCEPWEIGSDGDTAGQGHGGDNGEQGESSELRGKREQREGSRHHFRVSGLFFCREGREVG